jgi:ribosomal protein S14
MRHFNFKDLQNRKNFKRYEVERKRIKSICSNVHLPFNIRIFYFHKLSSFKRNSSITRIKNRCLLNCKSQSVYRFFHLNRISLREMMSLNLLNGLRKSGW